MSMPPTVERLLSIPPAEVTELLLAEPEGQLYDRKSVRLKGRQLAETLVAMANAEGGLIAIGLHQGACEGVDAHPDRQNDWQRAGLDFTHPPVPFEWNLVPCLNRRGVLDHVCVISVAPGRGVHAVVGDDVFLRVGDRSRKLTFDQRLALQYERGDTNFEVTPAEARLPVELDAARIAGFAEANRHPDPARLLDARGLMGPAGELLTAGALLFGVYPQRAYPQAFVRVRKYSGAEKRWGQDQNLALDVRCEGPLPAQIDQAAGVLREAVPKWRQLGPDGRFDWFPIVPEPVWLEALVNAVIHRAYSDFGDHIRVSVFDDRLEVSSPGRWPGRVLPTDLTTVRRFTRNPRIARVMAELSYGEEAGEGLRRMVAVMEANGRPTPRIRQTETSVEVILLGLASSTDRLADVPQLSRALYAHLAAAGRLRTGELVVLSGVSRPTVLRHLDVLESRQLVRRVSRSLTDPQAYWTVEVELETPAT